MRTSTNKLQTPPDSHEPNPANGAHTSWTNFRGSRQAPSAGVAKTLLQQINSGPDGHITRNVACGRGSKAGLAFTCDLKSVRSTSIRANVAVVGGTLRTTWEPIKG